MTASQRCTRCGRWITAARAHLPCPRCRSLDRSPQDSDFGHATETGWIQSAQTFYRFQPAWILVAFLIGAAAFSVGLFSLILGALVSLLAFVGSLFLTPRVVERSRDRWPAA